MKLARQELVREILFLQPLDTGFADDYTPGVQLALGTSKDNLETVTSQLQTSNADGRYRINEPDGTMADHIVAYKQAGAGTSQFISFNLLRVYPWYSVTLRRVMYWEPLIGLFIEPNVNDFSSNIGYLAEDTLKYDVNSYLDLNLEKVMIVKMVSIIGSPTNFAGTRDIDHVRAYDEVAREYKVCDLFGAIEGLGGDYACNNIVSDFVQI